MTIISVGIVFVERIGFTNNGNPRYSVLFKSDENPFHVVNGTTKPNGDGFESIPRGTDRARVEYRITARGRVIFDRVEALK